MARLWVADVSFAPDFSDKRSCGITLEVFVGKEQAAAASHLNSDSNFSATWSKD
jgi:hypothetical protein